jgi:hypothetical protein
VGAGPAARGEAAAVHPDRARRLRVRASEVEAFALMADDLRFVASQFRHLHSARIRHSPQVPILLGPVAYVGRVLHPGRLATTRKR